MRDRPRILVVDDDEAARDNLVHMLADGGHRIDVAEGGAEALGRLDERAYDLVLTGLEMAKVDGMEVLRHVKQHHRQCEVIVITSRATVA